MAMDLHLTQYTISASTVYIINAIQLKHITCHIYSIPAFFCHQLGKSTIKIPVLPAPLSYHLPLLTFSKAVSDKPKYVTLSASVSGTHTRCFIKKTPFYARQQNVSRVFAIVWASLRPSVCHTRELYQKGAS